MTDKFQKIYKVPKRYFSLNPFWSSPEILEFTMESYVLIGLKNMCSYVTLFELTDLFGIENVEQIVNKHKFGKPCLDYILNAIDLYKRKDKILNKEVNIELNIKGYSMKKETKQVLDKIKDFSFFKEKKAVLIGGTALSIHLKHRLSEDLDFMFYKEDTLPRDDLLLFQDKYKAEFKPFDTLTQQEFINDGGDINDYQQRFMIDGIKIEFIANIGNILEKNIINEDNIEEYKEIPIASLESLKQMKSLLLMDRNKIRDLYDVVYMIKNNILTVKEFINTIKKYRLTYEENYILNKIKNKQLSPNDEGLDGLTDNPPSFEELKNYLIIKIEQYLIGEENKNKKKKKYKFNKKKI